MYLNQPNERRYIMMRMVGAIDGDVKLSWWKRLKLRKAEGVWMIEPMSRCELLVKSLGKNIYIVDEKEHKPNILERIAIEIGEELVSKGRIHISIAANKYGNVRVDVQFGIPNLLWMLYPRGNLDIVRAPVIIKALSAISKPLFFFLDLFVKRWQHVVYRQVYQKAFTLFPQYTKEIYMGMTHPEIGM